MNIVNENSRYSVPMSLWLVAKTQRRQPCGSVVRMIVGVVVTRGYIVSDARHDNLLKRMLRHLVHPACSLSPEQARHVKQPD